MKRFPLWLLFLGAVVLASAGCGHVELASEGDPNRVVTGNVSVRMDLMPPSDAEVVVRVVEPPDVNATPVSASHDLVIGQRGTGVLPERVVGEQIIRAPAGMPVPFRIEFRADDTRVRRGLNIEARISWGGRVRFRNVESIAITPANIGGPIEIRVEPIR